MPDPFSQQDVTVGAAQDLFQPGDLGRKRVAPVYMDGVDILTLREAIAAQDRRAGQRQNQGTRFWATPPRLQDDNPVRDIFEVDLAQARLVNKISFDLARFPSRAVVEYSLTSDGAFEPLLDETGRAIVIEIVDSNPPILAQNATQSLAHPQHFGAGHWVSQNIKTIPVSASRFRVVLTRPNGGTPPTDTLGNPVRYSLGVRSFLVGYQVSTEADIPDRPLALGSQTLHRPIESTRDLLGSSVSYSERENPAKNLIGALGVWRSAPQPLPYAVVNLYADVRDENLAPVVIERFFIDPITSGCGLNLYYTKDLPDETQPDQWAFVRWTPVQRDFACRRGFLRFDPTLATFFKFEFSDLSPEPYDAADTIVRTVRLFPGGLESQDPISRSSNDGGEGTFINGALDGILRFDDAQDLPALQGLTDLSRGYSPTEVFYSKDPSAASRLRNLSEVYNYLPWQGETQMPHWPGTQIHNYFETEVLHEQRVAFYVAIANITPYRLDYSFDQDTDQYLEYFFDSSNIESNTGWIIEPEDARTPDAVGVPVVLTSETFLSRSNVRGIQFATTQSPPLQLLPDDDFNSGIVDPSVLNEDGDPVSRWETLSSNEALPQFTVTNEFNTDIGTTVQVKRAGSTETQPSPYDQNLYFQIARNYRTWKGITDAGVTYADLARVLSDAEKNRFGGIQNTARITPVMGARVYAAARVFSKIDLQEPLFLQIFDEISNTVVAEGPAEVSANKIVEWDITYDAGANRATEVRTWDQVAQTYPTYASMDGEVFFNIGSMQGMAVPVILRTRLVQKSIPNASFFVDTLSLFEDSILWEFSNNGGESWHQAPAIRNHPRGALIFPEAPETATYTTYESIEGRDPSPLLPTYGSLSVTRYKDLEHGTRTTPPNDKRLKWRVTCSRKGLHVNALSIRPWYINSGRGVLAHEGVDIAGPNKALYDHYQPIGFDPRYRLWHKPVPQAWYFFYRQFTLLRHDDYVETPVNVNTYLLDAFLLPRQAYVPVTDVLGDALVIPLGNQAPAPVDPLRAVLSESLILPTTEEP